ncbi:hypothetical protein R1flu_022442 [Riccia fluitans]|uniref:Uncharacterized protein n=1 Tax=Riccia fluitans TaxID=41844 RepID=A0ABD1XPS6_9MARC
MLTATKQYPTEAGKPNQIVNISPEIGLATEVILPTVTAPPVPHLPRINSTSAERSNRRPDSPNENGIDVGMSRLLCHDISEIGPDTIDQEIGHNAILIRSTSTAIAPFSKNLTPPTCVPTCPDQNGYHEMTTRMKIPNHVSNISRDAGFDEREFRNITFTSSPTRPSRKTGTNEMDPNCTSASMHRVRSG